MLYATFIKPHEIFRIIKFYKNKKYVAKYKNLKRYNYYFDLHYNFYFKNIF